MMRERANSLAIDAVLGQIRLAAVRQHVPITQYSETVYALHFGPGAERFSSPMIDCVSLHVEATEGVVLVTYENKSIMLSPTGADHQGHETVTQVDIPAHTSYLIEQVTDEATARLTGALDLEHRIAFIFGYLAARLHTAPRDPWHYRESPWRM